MIDIQLKRKGAYEKLCVYKFTSFVMFQKQPQGGTPYHVTASRLSKVTLFTSIILGNMDVNGAAMT